MGMQFFDVAIYAVGAGGVCLAVYRGLQGDGFGAIWNFPDAPSSTATEVILGAVVGAIAGGVGIGFRRCAHSTVLSAIYFVFHFVASNTACVLPRSISIERVISWTRKVLVDGKG